MPSSPREALGGSGSLALLAAAARTLAFLFACALVLVTVSEQVYWYWHGVGVGSLVELPLFYLVAALPALWLTQTLPARTVPQLVLISAMYAFLVEGVLTTVLYSDGPLPILAALFVGWHGLFAFVGGGYFTHLWLVRGELRKLAISMLLVGFGWGAWAAAAGLADPPAAFPDAMPFSAPAFAWYAFRVTAVFALAHWLVGLLLPAAARSWRWRDFFAVSLPALAFFTLTVLPAVPWAPLKLGVLLAGTWWLLQRSRASEPPDAAPLLERLTGRIRLRDTSVLFLAPATATASFALLTLLDHLGLLAAIYWFFTAVQVAVGALAMVWTARQVLVPHPAHGAK